MLFLFVHLFVAGSKIWTDLPASFWPPRLNSLSSWTDSMKLQLFSKISVCFKYTSVRIIEFVNNSMRKKVFFKSSFLIPYSSGSQTFLVCGPLKLFWCSAKHKTVIYIGIRGPLKLIWRTTSGLRSRLWESLPWSDVLSIKGRLYMTSQIFSIFSLYTFFS